ncbi:hypothetical protein [Aeromonas sp. FDAARGOS 1415]|uniref:hypothetical protein n=1 Tax=Aeromonas TaxID=642 RepID=UPI001C24AE5C|nr:hypothetical protein [Aeromonas sp. FDAARGOS 1415]QXB56839.1 hypothetical protein I6L45_11005 [Aeromonas sp. FDAARGOS 1415]
MKTFDAVSTLLIGANRLSISARNHTGIILAMSVTGIWGGKGMTGLHQAPNIMLATSVGRIQGGEA